MIKRKLIFFGLGPHAMTHQYSYLEQLYRQHHPIEVLLVVDLKSQQERIEQYLAGRALCPKAVYFTNEDPAEPKINEKLLSYLETIKHKADGVLVCTEPKAHKKYIQWALQNKLDVITDKPLTAPVQNNRLQPDQFISDYKEINQLAQQANKRCDMMTHKRIDAPYAELFHQARQLIEQTGLPITNINIIANGGWWDFPQEAITRENHPYKYGYGMLLHSGFHYVDLLAQLMMLNKQKDFKHDRFHVQTSVSTPYDDAQCIGQKQYEKLFPYTDFTPHFCTDTLQAAKFAAERNVHALVDFYRQDHTLTSVCLSLLQTSLSNRTAPLLHYDTSKNGNVRQDSITLQFGPLATLRYTFFDNGYNNYTIEIYRNPRLGKGLYQKIEIPVVIQDKETGKPTNTSLQAQHDLLRAWLARENSPCTIDTYELSIALLEALYKDIFRKKTTGQ